MNDEENPDFDYPVEDMGPPDDSFRMLYNRNVPSKPILLSMMRDSEKKHKERKKKARKSVSEERVTIAPSDKSPLL